MRNTEELLTTLRGIEHRLNYSMLTFDDIMGLLATCAAMFGLLISPQPLDKPALYVRCNSARRNIQETTFFGITYRIQQELLDIIDVTESLLTESCGNRDALREWRDILRRLFETCNDLYLQEVADAATT